MLGQASWFLGHDFYLSRQVCYLGRRLVCIHTLRDFACTHYIPNRHLGWASNRDIKRYRIVSTCTEVSLRKRRKGQNAIRYPMVHFGTPPRGTFSLWYPKVSNVVGHLIVESLLVSIRYQIAMLYQVCISRLGRSGTYLVPIRYQIVKYTNVIYTVRYPTR